MDGRTVGVALYGLGRIGKIHLNNLVSNKRIRLLWIVEAVEAPVTAAMDQFGGMGDVQFAKLEDIPKVLADKRVDAVVICTPTDTHVPLSIQAMQAGKHVMCEKPISEDTEAVKKCFDVAEQTGKVLMAAFNRKFDASYRSIYQKVNNGDVGKMRMIRSVFRDAPLWLGTTTFTQTFLSHDIDVLCSFAGGVLPTSVVCMATANIKEVKENKDVDFLVATMTFPNDIIGVLDFSRHSDYGYDIRLEVFGSKGMLQMEMPLVNSVYKFQADGKKDPPFLESFPDRFHTAYITELDHFLDVIHGAAKLEVTRDHCERIGVVCDALRESYNTGKIVKIPAP